MRTILFIFLAFVSSVSYSQDSTLIIKEKVDSLAIETKTQEVTIQRQKITIDSLKLQVLSFANQNTNLKIQLDRVPTSTKILLVFLIIIILIITYFYMKIKPRKLKNLRPNRAHFNSLKPFVAEENPRVNINKWFVVYGSVKGNSHISQNIPCQDDSFYMPLANGWGIAVVCDGAGSAKNSDMGSKYATQVICKLFADSIEKEGWLISQKLPNQVEWERIARDELKMALSGLNKYASDKELELTSLACTAIVVIHSPYGLLVTHIGDGRAGFCDENGKWHSSIIPHKGEEANQTIFLSSYAWIKNETLQMSGVKVPESRVINQKVTAFTLMSDGCEQHSFECSLFDPASQQWSDPNIPYANFFNPLVSQIRSVATKNSTNLEVNDNWKMFLENGNMGLKNEPDDKTLILGVLV